MIVYTVFGEEIIQTKVCRICKRELPLSEYREHHRRAGDIIVLNSRCNDCIKSVTKHLDTLRESAPYQPICCEICGKESKRYDLDHNHKTGKFRGWLCPQCNRSLGHFGDDLEGIMRVVRYLENKDG